MKFKLSRSEVLNLEFTFKKEYLLTNSLGAYASSSLLDCHTRKYHGLLVVPNYKSGKMFNLLSKLEVAVEIEKRDFSLSTNKFPGVFSPTGHQYVDSIEVDDFPVTTYKIADITIRKSILMPRGKESVLIRYDIVSAPFPLLLKMSPLLAYREAHALSRENMHIRPRPFIEKNGFKIDPYEGMPPLHLETSAASRFFPSPTWWKGFEYLKERNRGYEYQEDLFCPGIFELKLKRGDSVIFRASTDKSRETVGKDWSEETKRLKAVSKRFLKEKEPQKTLKKSAFHFITHYPNKQPGIRAGFHWYGENGRDTLISIPGLLTRTGERESALAILRRFARYERNGLMPDTLSADGLHDYANCDVSFWFIRAVQDTLAKTGDRKGVEKDFLKTMTAVVTAHLDNRAPGCRIADNGFIYAGGSSDRFTWMNARAYGAPVTPRHGAAVEVNALWYNALRFLTAEFEAKLDPALLKRMTGTLARFEANFLSAFWNEKARCLCDVFREGGDRDLSIRPNQLFAAGLPYSCLDPKKIQPMLETINYHLVTPMGLRTLSPDSPLYQAVYTGDIESRENAAHQGMVYPWLIGIYADTLRKIVPVKVVKSHLRETFRELTEEHLNYYGIFQVSEMFTPNPPHIAKGTMGQARNLAELIRAFDDLVSP